MKSLRPLTIALLTAGICFSAGADDGEINNKSMTKTINDLVELPNVPVFGIDNVDEAVPVAEHAFTSMMGFYVPAQKSSGLVEPIEYYNDDGALVETLASAKPLVNVFIYGPALEVEGTAFAHSYMDVYGAVSLDDGVTFKKTNLSESADLTSFDILVDHEPADEEEPSVAHTINRGGNLHAEGGELPFTGPQHCVECHGSALQGTTQAPTCYSCHADKVDKTFDEPIPEKFGPLVYEAILDGDGMLMGKGLNALSESVELVNAANGESVAYSDTVKKDGLFDFGFEPLAEPPCAIAAKNGDYQSPAIAVLNPQGEQIQHCDGLLSEVDEDPEDEVVEMPYPGGVGNVFHAVAGNKVLVAWPSRFCEQGQPAYSFAYDASTDEKPELVTKRNTLAAYLGIDVLADLYLTDLFGVGGAQGSIDFADEGYPQAGVVPFSCVWTARGVLLPGDDPRTGEIESSHMVWTKAERLTSGRRDPNRIEVKGVAGAGFVITWQEDPDGLRPGQGEGPGEGWSGAVAHDKTDIWYSFIPWEHFDTVESIFDDTGLTPINIAEHDLTASGRPQVYVPMAVPMRLTNNDKCQADEYGPGATPSENKAFSYCNEAVATLYGFQDFCADTVEIPQGPQATLQPICVNADDLPNIANTGATRARLSLQGYDSDGDDLVDSAWVIVAAEEMKGLGRYTFLPDGTACEEGSSPDCTADIGKNQWYFSFDMGDPATSVDAELEHGLVQNLVSQGNLLNQPEIDWRTGEFYPVINTADMWDFGAYNFDMYNTEIARRASLLVQPIAKAEASTGGLLAMPSWKQGAMRQGGPADTMLRRIVNSDDSNGTEAPPKCEDVDYDLTGPTILSADTRLTYVDGVFDNIKLAVTGEGADDSNKTDVLFRDAMNGDLFDPRFIASTDEFSTEFNLPGIDAVPCSIQAADEGEENWGLPFQVATDQDCINPLPAACTADAIHEYEDYVSSRNSSSENPYAFVNMDCTFPEGTTGPDGRAGGWILTDGSNPYYPNGICTAPATNLSGVIPDTCSDDGTGSDTDCPAVDFASSTFGISETNPILQGYEQGEGNTMRVLTWHQCPSDGVQITGDGVTVPLCDSDDREDGFANLADQSWYNPLDVSKGHRGFIDGDFVMFLYAWSPNWRLNAKGNDRYELYIRRSFDGGATWTTLPSSFTASDGLSYSGDGTVTCESYRTDKNEPSTEEDKACFDFEAGVAEHARNVTQHKAMGITTLDPRYSASRASITDTCVTDLGLPDSVDGSIWTCDDVSAELDSDLRNPSRYFIAFETGDNKTVAVGEAEPLNLYYSRAESFGDDYVVWTETDSSTADATLCYPSDPHDVDVDEAIVGSGFCNEFDRMNTGTSSEASEASLTANPDGSKMYGVWSQWREVTENSEDEDAQVGDHISDAMARRVWWIDDYIPAESYTLPGTNQQ
jgi:hypothetical protein